MTLRVPFNEFGDTVRRMLGHEEAFVAPFGSGSLATSSKTNGSLVIASVCEDPADTASAKLSSAGLQVRRGEWLVDRNILSADLPPIAAYVAAIAYVSSENVPGVWVDAFDSLPTKVQVLRALYEDFENTGELSGVSFEEFVRLANPNVIIVSPAELKSFLDEKEGC